MLEDFEAAEVPTGETSIFLQWTRSGAPILLLHGFPETHLMCRSRAPRCSCALIPEPPRPDYKFRMGLSAMCQTELEELLRALGAETCVFTGMVTNGVVEGTARDASMREYHVVTLADYVAGYRQDLHEAPLKNLGNIGREEFLRGLRAQP